MDYKKVIHNIMKSCSFIGPVCHVSRVTQLYEECHAENRQLSHDIHGVRGQLDTVKHQLELAAEVGTYSDTRAGNKGKVHTKIRNHG